MNEKDLKVPEAHNDNQDFVTSKVLLSAHIVFDLMCRKVLTKARDGRISFASADQLCEIRFNYEERITLMKAMTDAGILRFRTFHGWYVVPNKDMAVEP